MVGDLRVLGRGIVVSPGDAGPRAFQGVPRVVVDDDALAGPASTVATLHGHWLARRSVVVELAASPSELRAPQVDEREPWKAGVDCELGRERLQFLVWANNWDGRSGTPVWWWGRKAARLGATVDGPADIVLGDGRPAFVDGGPRGSAATSIGVGTTEAPIVHRESVDAGELRLGQFRLPTAVLAPDQLSAVTHDAGPARVIAPAGSGKTRVLTERLRHLLADRGWESSTVTAVAFNKRASEELSSRTTGLGAHVRTIHALGLAVLSGVLGGPRPARRPSVIDEAEVRRVLDGIVEVRHQANTDVLAPYIEALAAIRIGLRDPAEVQGAFPDAEGLDMVWRRYRDALERVGAIDFDDQIERAIALLLREPEVRAAAQRRCRHLLVDEFQDLAPAHVLLLRLLSAPAYDVFGVGDDDQVIYGYAGATPSFLIDFDRWFPGAAAHALTMNYRCPTRVVAGARHLLSYNRRRIPKEIHTPQGATAGSLEVHRVASAGMAESAVRAVTVALGDMTASPVGDAPGAAPAELDADAAGAPTARPARSPSEVAVLARVNSALLPVQVALGDAGIPTTTPLDRRVLDRTGVRTALAWMRLGMGPRSLARTDVIETIRRPSRRMSRNVVEMVTRRPQSSVAEVRRLAGRLSGGDVDKLLGYAADIEAVAASVADGTAAVLRTIGTTVGLGQAMEGLDASRTEADRSSHGDDLRALEQVAALHPDPATFAGWLEGHLARRSAPGDAVVTLSTVHRVKGQEWPVVVIFGAHASAFPHRLATDVEEERRVFHVALTRASATAIVLADRAEPSPFVAELDGSRPVSTLCGRAGTVAPAGMASRRQPGTIRGAPDGPPLAADLWQALKAWRREVADRNGMPAFLVLGDADLRNVGQRRPTTMVELRRCRGLGPTKLERYGDELLALLEAFAPRDLD